MKIAFYVNRDVHAAAALTCLRDVLDAHRCVAFASDGVGKPAALPQLAQLAAFEHRASFSELDSMTENNPNSPEALARLGRFEPDVIISIRYGRIFKNDFLAIPRLGVLNLHSGILPSYRGVLATFRALLDDVDEIGCTLHFIDDASIDTGRIVAIARLPAEKGESLFAQVHALYEPGATLIRSAIARLESGESLATRKQSPDAGRYFSYPTVDEVAAFEAKGFPFVSEADQLAFSSG